MSLLTGLLRQGLKQNPAIDYSEFECDRYYPAFTPPEALAVPEPPVVRREAEPPPKWLLAAVFRSHRERYEAQCNQAVAMVEDAYRQACEQRVAREQSRVRGLEAAKSHHEDKAREHRLKAADKNKEIKKRAAKYRQGEPQEVAAYCKEVLVRMQNSYPKPGPRSTKIAYVSESKQLVVEYTLPSTKVIPADREFRYIESRDEIVPTKLRVSERSRMYAEVISAVAVRVLSDLFRADEAGHLSVIVFNGYAHTIDAGTGKKIRPCLVSVQATRPVFSELKLDRVNAIACLKHLKAQVSRNPAELIPVRPIIEFKMADPRFVRHGNVLRELDSRPNLMEMSPGEFEVLITNLFESLGLETKLTRPSRDGGVDCVAYDQRPILGGKVVIQAKRYKHTVGVSAVRDLFGTMHNEGANKGILVTTSGYGRASFEFAVDKPLELISGSNLLYLLEQQGVTAKIEAPDDWVDPDPFGPDQD